MKKVLTIFVNSILQANDISLESQIDYVHYNYAEGLLSIHLDVPTRGVGQVAPSSLISPPPQKESSIMGTTQQDELATELTNTVDKLIAALEDGDLVEAKSLSAKLGRLRSELDSLIDELSSDG